MKKNIFASLCLLALTTQNLNAQNLTVHVNGIIKGVGSIRAAVYDELNYLTRPLQAKEVKASDTSLTLVFENVTPGKYCVILYQDKNENKSLDYGNMGIPSEPFGFSGNGMPMGVPSFNDIAFEMKDDTEKNIGLFDLSHMF